MINGSGSFSGYVENNRMGVGLFFIFVACAGISIIVWVFNWICWLNQCCCCDFLHNPINKRITWWMSFIFLLGILACCIAGCVSVNRFGFALEGARCALDRIYYDSVNGQLNQIDGEEPKWKGFSNLIQILKKFYSKSNSNPSEGFIEKVKDSYNYDETLDSLTENQNHWKNKYSFSEEDNKYYSKYSEMKSSFENIASIAYRKKEDVSGEDYGINRLINIFEGEKTNFYYIKGNFTKDFYERQEILINSLKKVAMVYFCLFLIADTMACISLMFYACLKRQGYLITLMHILWNIIRFFMVSFFLFGTAYGIIYLILIDCMAVFKDLFSEDFMKQNDYMPNSDFIKNCLENYNYKYEINNDIRVPIESFFYHYQELIKLMNTDKIDTDRKKYFVCNGETTLCNDLGWSDLAKNLNSKGNFFDSFNCGFLQSDLNILYKALYDASKESEYLSAVSLCSSFFGAVAVYFFLLVLHHYNNEMFYDSGKSIFKGFDGYGGGFKKKNIQQDPAYKKRKLRAEIELTSKNDEANGYNKDINKNDDEE